ncbi:MAG: GtrA family protein [Clostridia bacterium]|nr:GtrA family protein [Clostridia bacterium]
MEKFWTFVEKIPLYKKLSEHMLFGKIFNREVLSYLFFGAMTTVVSLVSFYIADKLFSTVGWLGIFHYISGSEKDFAYLDANVISFICAVAFAFITNKLFVFDSKSFEKKTLAKELFSFVGARIATFAIDSLLMFLLVTVMSVNEMVSKVLVQIIVVILNYVFSKLFVFRKNKGD